MVIMRMLALKGFEKKRSGSILSHFVAIRFKRLRKAKDSSYKMLRRLITFLLLITVFKNTNMAVAQPARWPKNVWSSNFM
jgi:hypothetical protein